MPTAGQGIEQLAPVETANLHERVYLHLREALMAGKFRPGEPLTLRALAGALGTSVIPARDAVLRLSAERALVRAGRSVQVPVLERQQLQDILRFRVLLEGEAAALAAERATAEDVAAIEAANERVLRARQGRQLDRFLAANQRFHFAVYAGAHNDLLQSMIETLWLQIGPHLAYAAATRRVTDLTGVDLTPHDRMIEAIRGRDGRAARAALRADLEDNRDVFEPIEPAPRARGRAAP